MSDRITNGLYVLALACAFAMGLLMGIAGPASVAALGYLFVVVLLATLGCRLMIVRRPCGAPSPDDGEEAEGVAERDETAERRSDFCGYCAYCGRPVFTHHVVMLDDRTPGNVCHDFCM